MYIRNMKEGEKDNPDKQDIYDREIGRFQKTNV